MVNAARRLASATLTTQILIALALGSVFGLVLNYLDIDALNITLVQGVLSMFGQMFLNALQMLVVPLVVFSLLCGVVGIGDVRLLGRVGGLTFVTYLATTALAVTTALILVTKGSNVLPVGIENKDRRMVFLLLVAFVNYIQIASLVQRDIVGCLPSKLARQLSKIMMDFVLVGTCANDH